MVESASDGQMSGFAFLAAYAPEAQRLAAEAEALINTYPDLALIRLRQFAVSLSQNEIGPRFGVMVKDRETQENFLLRLKRRPDIPPQVIRLLHEIRTVGNEAMHELSGTRDDVQECLQKSFELAVWFHKTYADKSFRPDEYRRRLGGKQREEIVRNHTILLPDLPQRGARMKGAGRVNFLAHRAEIEAELEAGWPIKAVYKRRAEKLAISYPQFARYVDSIIRCSEVQ